MSKPLVLIVDDDTYYCGFLGTIVRDQNCEPLESHSVEDALELIRQHDINAILLDLRLPEMDGLELLRQLSAIKPDIPTTVLTAYQDVNSAVTAIKLGAYDYILKPPTVERLQLILSRMLELSTLRKETAYKLSFQVPNLIGTSPSMQKLLEQIKKIAPFDVTILIQGESGSGKEVVARLIAARSLRATKPFVVIDCGALTETLITSELFGHEKGAFTGADDARPGLFVKAHRGTILLDEIGNLPLTAQTKLLRVIENREVVPVGSCDPIHCDVRIIAAINCDLKELVKTEKFRLDLFHRLKVVKIDVPPLRIRDRDIELLARYFIDKYSRDLNKPTDGLDQDALELLMNYTWPGNVRELANVIQHAVLISNGKIRTNDLPSELLDGLAISASQEVSRLKHHSSQAECEAIKNTLLSYGGNKTKAARALGIDVKTLYNKLKRYKVELTK